MAILKLLENPEARQCLQELIVYFKNAIHSTDENQETNLEILGFPHGIAVAADCCRLAY
ncbi:hypothetical protein GCM10028805_59610 [Spirosoma harenae]